MIKCSPLIRVKTIALQGAKPIGVDIEAHISHGIPSFHIVGLPSKSINEAKDRIYATLESLGLQQPSQKIIINLSPSGLQKDGTHYDVPIILALLVAMKVIDPLEEYLAIGELSLDGKFLPVRGALSAAMYAESEGLHLICPAPCGSEAAWGVENQQVIAPENLTALINHLKGTRVLSEPTKQIQPYRQKTHIFDSIEGQEDAKDAIKIACAGSHHLIMVGPPGVGKSMLARSMIELLPQLTAAEALETTQIHSLMGPVQGVILEPPFRSPHYTASIPGMIGGGGGHYVLPGEVSLAHNGILFLDEFSEGNFHESLRTVIETGSVEIVRAQCHISYPAQFILVAAMNPCKCGYLGDSRFECSKAPKCGEKQTQKISGPILDRIDLAIHVNRNNGNANHTPFETIKAQIIAAREIQAKRFENQSFKTNGRIPGGRVKEFVHLTQDAQKTLSKAVAHTLLSYRGRDRVLRVARTIADLAHEEYVGTEHILQALSYRQELSLKNRTMERSVSYIHNSI